MLVELTLSADERSAEALADALVEAGALSVALEDANAETPDEQPLFGEPGLVPERHAWTASRLRVLVEDEAGEGVVRAAATAVGIAPPTIECRTTVADTDWVLATQSQFPPTRISDRLWIVPTWHEPPDPDAVVVRLDPGVAFGTGTHPTTRLCLRWLDASLRKGATVLDYGISGDAGVQHRWGKRLVRWYASLGNEPRVTDDLDITKYGGFCEVATQLVVLASPLETWTSRHLANLGFAFAAFLAVLRMGRRLGGGAGGFFALLFLVLTPPSPRIDNRPPICAAKTSSSVDPWVLRGATGSGGIPIPSSSTSSKPRSFPPLKRMEMRPLSRSAKACLRALMISSLMMRLRGTTISMLNVRGWISRDRSTPRALRAWRASLDRISPVPQPTSSTSRPRTRPATAATSDSSRNRWYPWWRSRS